MNPYPDTIYINAYGTIMENHEPGFIEYRRIYSDLETWREKQRRLFIEVCNINGKTPDEISENPKIRKHEYLECRYWDWVFKCIFDGMPPCEAGYIYAKDYATVLNGLRRITLLILYDKYFQLKYDRIIRFIDIEKIRRYSESI